LDFFKFKKWIKYRIQRCMICHKKIINNLCFNHSTVLVKLAGIDHNVLIKKSLVGHDYLINQKKSSCQIIIYSLFRKAINPFQNRSAHVLYTHLRPEIIQGLRRTVLWRFLNGYSPGGTNLMIIQIATIV
jgi:nanoRNase/pAp phosphatase (c-di-AMP/oligoRNAs hydrolase)